MARFPITRSQLSDLLGAGENQIRLVVGSAATDLDMLVPALRSAAAEMPPRLEVAVANSKPAYRKELADGGSELPRLVVADLRKATSFDAIDEAVDSADRCCLGMAGDP